MQANLSEFRGISENIIQNADLLFIASLRHQEKQLENTSYGGVSQASIFLNVNKVHVHTCIDKTKN